MSKRRLTFPYATGANPESLMDRLGSDLWEEDETPWTIRRIEVMKTWELADRSTVLYQVHFALEEMTRKQMYVGHVARRTELLDLHREVLESTLIQPKIGKAVVILEDANLVLVAFPNDRKMSLIAVEDFKEWLPTHLEEISQGRLCGNWEVVDGRIKMLKYAPGKRYTARCDFRLRSISSGDLEDVSFVSKQVADERKASLLQDTLESLGRIWGPATGSHLDRTNLEGVRVPAVLGTFSEKAALLIEFIKGKDLKRALPDLDPDKVLPFAGKVLASFHKTDHQVKKRMQRADVLDEVQVAAAATAESLPRHRVKLLSLVDELSEVSREPEDRSVLLHGSYRLNHLFVHPKGLTLLDLDSVCMGHPAFDLGNFLSSNYYLEAQGRFEKEEHKTIQKLFLQGYAEESEFTVDPKTVLWYLASLLVKKQALKYVKHAHVGSFLKVAAVLKIAEEVLRVRNQICGTESLTDLGEMLP